MQTKKLRLSAKKNKNSPIVVLTSIDFDDTKSLEKTEFKVSPQTSSAEKPL